MPEDAINTQQLRAFVERIRRIDTEMQAAKDEKKELMAEIKASGFDTKYIALAMKFQDMEAEELQEYDAMVETYRNALGVGN